MTELKPWDCGGECISGETVNAPRNCEDCWAQCMVVATDIHAELGEKDEN